MDADASKTAQTLAVAHAGNGLVLLKQAAIMFHQNALEDQRSSVSTFLEGQAKKLDAIYDEIEHFNPYVDSTTSQPGRIKT